MSTPIWRFQAPSGASIAHHPPADDVLPDDRSVTEQEIISLGSSWGYGMGMPPEDFDELALAWVEHRGLAVGRALGDRPGELPREPALRTHANNARYGAAVRAILDELALGIAAVNKRPSVLKAAETETLRDLWTEARKLKENIEGEGSTRE